MTENGAPSRRRLAGTRLLGVILADGRTDGAIELAVARVLTGQVGSAFQAPDFAAQFADDERAAEALGRGDDAWRAVEEAWSGLERVADDLMVQRRQVMAEFSGNRSGLRAALGELENRSGVAAANLKLTRALTDLAEVCEAYPRRNASA
jgi:hypothetical protein